VKPLKSPQASGSERGLAEPSGEGMAAQGAEAFDEKGGFEFDNEARTVCAPSFFPGV